MKKFILMSLLVLFSPVVMAGEMPVTPKELAWWTRGQQFHILQLPGIHFQPVKNLDSTAEIKAGMIIELCTLEKDFTGESIVYFGYADKTNTFHEYVYNFKTKKFEESIFTEEQAKIVRQTCSQCHPFEYKIETKKNG